MEKIYNYGCRAVNFTGGEPTVRRDLEQIIDYASGLGMWTSLVTNGGVLTGARVRALRDAGLDNLLVSLDSLDPTIHDKQRGVSGLHAKVTRCARWISGDFLTGHRTGGIMTVLTNLNVEEIDRIVQFADQLGVYVLFQPYHDNKTGSAAFNANIEQALGEDLVRLKRRRKNILNSESYLRELPRFYERSCQPRCNAGRKYFSIDPYGFLHPCVDMPKAGHLLDDDVSVVRSMEAMNHVASCTGCWYCFRGESDVTLSYRGCLEKLQLGLGVMVRNKRRRRMKRCVA